MAANPLVHIGLAKTATTFLQRAVFPKLSTVHYLGKNSPSEDLNRAGRSIVRRTSLTWNLADVADTFRKEMRNISGSNRPVLSEEDLSVFKFMDPQTCAGRLRDIFGKYDVLLVIRDPVTWVQSNYNFRLSTFHPKCFWGINHWLREQKNVVGIGSDVTEIHFARLARVYAAQCGGTVNILPYELLKADKMAFGDRLARIVKADVEEARRLISQDSKPLDKGRISTAESDFIKEARFIAQRDYLTFGHRLDFYCSKPNARPDSDALGELRRLVSAEEDDFSKWRPALAKLKQSLASIFADSPDAQETISAEFLEWLNHVARMQVNALRKNFGFDLGKDGIRYTYTKELTGNGP